MSSPSRKKATLSIWSGRGHAVLCAGFLAGCGGAPKAPAESAVPAPEPSTAAPVAPESASAPPTSEGTDAKGPPSATASAAPSAEPPAPKRRSAPVEIAVTGKFAGDAAVDGVIQNARTGLQNCYESALEGTPKAMGTMDFHIKLTDSGAIKKVESAHPNTMPGTVATCMVGKFGALSFEPKPARTIDVKVSCKPNE